MQEELRWVHIVDNKQNIAYIKKYKDAMKSEKVVGVYLDSRVAARYATTQAKRFGMEYIPISKVNSDSRIPKKKTRRSRGVG